MVTNDKKKNGGGGVLLLILAAGGAWLASKLKATGTQLGAGISILVYDAGGNIVPMHSPRTVYEGETYTYLVTVINTTTKLGTRYAASFTIRTGALNVNGVTFTPTSEVTAAFSASQQLTFGPFAMTIPNGAAGITGEIFAMVIAPTGFTVADVADPLTVMGAPIVYSANVTIT